jgi:MurNAc alpha-1-phosphate uridylyltransferase
VLNGDIYTEFPLDAMPAAPPAGSNLHLLLTPRPARRATGDFEFAAGRVTARGNSCVYEGISVLRPELFAGRTVAPFSLRDLMFEELAHGRLTAQLWDGFWIDIGTQADLDALDAHLRRTSLQR